MRVREVGRTIDEASCEREPTPWGLFIWNDEFPLVSDANTAWILRWPGGITPEAWAHDVASRFRKRGRSKARVRFGDSPHSELASHLEGPFRRAGFVPGSVVLDLARARIPAERALSSVPIREVTDDEEEGCWRLAEVSLVEDGFAKQEGTQLLALSRRRYRTLGMRFFLATMAGESAGYATLYSKDAMGYIEDLYTAPRFRKHGVGSGLVRAAIAASAEHGDEHVGLTTASTNDTAQRLYRTIGFEVVGTGREFAQHFPAGEIL